MECVIVACLSMGDATSESIVGHDLCLSQFRSADEYLYKLFYAFRIVPWFGGDWSGGIFDDEKTSYELAR